MQQLHSNRSKYQEVQELDMPNHCTEKNLVKLYKTDNLSGASQKNDKIRYVPHEVFFYVTHDGHQNCFKKFHEHFEGF